MATLPRTLALSGPMGSGKSTLGKLLSERFGVPLVDTDARIEAEGRTVAELFATEGEAVFREREAAVVAEALAGPPCVLALGGGVVTNPLLRRALLARTCLVTLRAPARALVARLDAAARAARPLLANDPIPRLEAILASRAEAYAEAHAIVDVEGRSLSSIAEEITRVSARDAVVVALGARTYQVEVAPGCIARLPEIVARSRALLVSDTEIHPHVQRRIPRLDAPLHLLAPGEANKTIVNVATIWDAALAAGLDRRSLLVAIGGGVVGDLVGFAAATLLRGVRFVQVPTTLLAMVDASVGGKTAIDRPEGKNLVGAFHQPSAVLADPELLGTLPARELRSGLAEVVKTALVGDRALLDDVERHAEALLAGDKAALTRVVRASVLHKARVVAEDERDQSDARAALNFGHTIGHALEAHHGYARWTHGEAVALGMIAALRVGVGLGVTEKALLVRVRDLLLRLGLPVALDDEPLAEAMPRVMADKKREGDKVAYVLIRSAGEPLVQRLTPTDISTFAARNLEGSAVAP
ncbi:MAG: 3-dehydroquinate synthase [Myxococcales bacterium]|nr:3-dehydroquinate synthase [Myxococcales bacterium]